MEKEKKKRKQSLGSQVLNFAGDNSSLLKAPPSSPPPQPLAGSGQEIRRPGQYDKAGICMK